MERWPNLKCLIDCLSGEEGFFDRATCALSRALGKGLRVGLVPTHSIIDCLFSLLDDLGLVANISLTKASATSNPFHSSNYCLWKGASLEMSQLLGFYTRTDSCLYDSRGIEYVLKWWLTLIRIPIGAFLLCFFLPLFLSPLHQRLLQHSNYSPSLNPHQYLLTLLLRRLRCDGRHRPYI